MRYPVTVTKLLQELPPFQDEWITVKKRQNVWDIIKEVINDHNEFKNHYDKIALYFTGSDIKETADNIFCFLKKNIRYKEESEEEQTTSIPAGILIRKQGDCKHYAILSGGILDALKRRGKKIDWCYRFASYDFTDETPHHVFIVINDRGREITIDPTPGSETKVPVWILDKHIKPNSMALRKNIAGIGITDSSSDSGGEVDTGMIIFDLASKFLNSLFGSFVIGDQVPEYPIKSKNTLKGILAEIQSQFPDPVNVADAERLYQKALVQIAAAEEKIRQKSLAGKNTAVDETYKMIYQEVADTYLNYIDIHSNENTGTYDPTQTSSGPSDEYTPPKPIEDKKTNPLLYAGLAAGGILLISNMGTPKPRRKVSGIGSGLLLALAIGTGVYFITNKKSGPSTQKKREALLDWSDDARSDEIFLEMTDDEINTVYEAVFIVTERPLAEGPLRDKFSAISDKYQIFT